MMSLFSADIDAKTVYMKSYDDEYCFAEQYQYNEVSSAQA